MNTVWMGALLGLLAFIIMALFEKDRALKSRSYTHCLGAMAGTGAFGAMLGAIVALVISSYSPMVEQLVDYKIVVPALDSNGTNYLSTVRQRGGAKLFFYVRNQDDSVSPHSLWADQRVKIISTDKVGKRAYLVVYGEVCDPNWFLSSWSFCERKYKLSRWELHIPDHF